MQHEEIGIGMGEIGNNILHLVCTPEDHLFDILSGVGGRLVYVCVFCLSDES